MTTTNKVILVGPVGRDPDFTEPDFTTESIHTPTATAVFSLATKRKPSARSAAEDSHSSERTDWHRLVCTGKLAEFARDNVRCHDRIYVEGSLEYGSWERDGITYPTCHIRVAEIVVLPNNRSTSA